MKRNENKALKNLLQVQASPRDDALQAEKSRSTRPGSVASSRTPFTHTP